jgi:LysM repeat protein
MRRVFLIRLSLLIVLVLALALPATQVRAATSVTASDLIGLVNGIRASNGLPPLAVNTILMGTAESTAETMAANGSCSHIGDVRGRVAAAGYGGGTTVFATENIACGYSATISDIQGWWSDSLHMLPMVGASYTDIGAAVFNSGGMNYFVLHAAYSAGGNTSGRVPGSNGGSDTTSPIVSQYIYGVVTATPQADGSITHVVEYGQALSSIAVAYGVTVAELQALNHLSGINIYVGDVLIIRAAPTPTVSPTRTSTVQRPTRTPSSTPTPYTPRPTRTPTVTPTPGILDSLPKVDRSTVGFGLVVVSAVGLIAMIGTSMFKKKPGK